MSSSPTRLIRSILIHSALVRVLRLILPVFTGLILLLVFIWPNVKKIKEPPPHYNKHKRANLVINPRMVSTDDKGKAYSIQAKSAEQTGKIRAHLNEPQGNFTLEDGTKVHVKAKLGDFEKNKDALSLSGSVSLESETGYRLNAPSAVINLKTKTAETFEPVHGQGPQGTIRSEGGVKIEPNGVIKFKGKTQLVIHSQGDQNGHLD